MKGKMVKYIPLMILLPFIASCQAKTTESTPTTSTTSSEVIETRKAVHFVGNDLAYAIGLDALVEPGTNVNFKVAAKSGYEITKVEAETEAAEVEITGNANEGYSFVMPEDDITITATALGAYFKVSCNPDEVVFKPAWESASEKKNKDFIAAFITEEGKTTGQSAFARAGEKVNIAVNTIATAKDVVVKVNGVEATKENYEVKNDEGETTDTYNTYAFTMPNTNAEIEVECVENSFNVNYQEGDYYIGEVLVKNADGDYEPAGTVKGGTDVYFRLALNQGEEENYTFKGCNVVYTTYSGYSLKESAPSKNMATAVSGEEGVYKYTVSTFTNYASGIMFVPEYAENVYAGKEFTGTYKGCNIYSSANSFVTDTTFIVGLDGSFKYGKYSYSTTTAENLDEANKTLDIGGKENYKLHYDTNALWFTYSAGGSETDIYIGFKDFDSETMETKMVNKISANGMYFAQCIDKATGNEIANFMRIGGHNYLNVTVEFEEGSTEVTQDAKFRVYKDGVKVGQHNISDDPAEDISYLDGTYSKDSNTMTLNTSTMKGTWNGAEFTFTYNAATKKGAMSDFGAFDDGENAFEYIEATNSIKVSLSGDYGTNRFSDTLAKQS